MGYAQCAENVVDVAVIPCLCHEAYTCGQFVLGYACVLLHRDLCYPTQPFSVS